MSKTNLIEIMTIVNLPASCLNRDEAGIPKECNFAGYDRARVSSQAQKFAIRQSEEFKALCDKVSGSIRTAYVHEYIIPRLRNLPEGFEIAIADLCGTLNESPVEEKKCNVSLDKKTGEFIFKKISKDMPTFKERKLNIMAFSDSQIDALVDIIQSFVDASEGDIRKFVEFKNRNVFDAMKKQKVEPMTLDKALFGSMTASVFSTNIPASMHVSQMFSTDALTREDDYYIASDDFVLANPDKAAGASNLGYIGYNCSCMYRYACIDLDILRENLKNVENSEEVIKEVVSELVRIFAMTLPKSKQTTNAAYVLPDMICVNLKDKKIACNHANAFAIPAKATVNQGVIENSIEKFIGEVDKMDRFYDMEVVERFFMNVRTTEAPKNATYIESMRELVEGIKANL